MGRLESMAKRPYLIEHDIKRIHLIRQSSTPAIADNVLTHPRRRCRRSSWPPDRLAINENASSNDCTGTERDLKWDRWSYNTLKTLGLVVGIPLVIVTLLIVLGFCIAILALYPLVVIRALSLLQGDLLFLWKLLRNPLEYTTLGTTRNEIRILAISRDALGLRLRGCISYESWTQTEYEALSYTWSSRETLWGSNEAFLAIGTQYLIISSNLERALRRLTTDGCHRRVWVDQACIDQERPEDKACQIPNMFSIYQHAKRVLVWLDIDDDVHADEQAIETFCSRLDLMQVDEDSVQGFIDNLSNEERQTLQIIFAAPWWRRVWVLQEVAAARELFVMCKRSLLSWDRLCLLAGSANTERPLLIPPATRKFIHFVQAFRARGPVAGTDILALSYHFRELSASIPIDRVYALMNLVHQPVQAFQFPINYSEDPLKAAENIQKWCLVMHRSLACFTALESMNPSYWRELDTSHPTWACLWGYQHLARAEREPLWVGHFEDSTTQDLGDAPKFSCTGDALACCRLDLPDPQILGLQDFPLDIVASIGPSYRRTMALSKKRRILRKWETLASGPRLLDNIEEPDQKLLNILLGGSKTSDALTWHEILDKGDSQSMKRLDQICSGRRFFVTKRGKFGIGHSSLRGKDLICALLGSAVPYVLRRSTHRGLRILHSHSTACGTWTSGFTQCARSKHSTYCMPVLHCLVGQAYVNGYMHYEGDIHDDIRTGRLTLIEFLIE